jgi:hypothetical protein
MILSSEANTKLEFLCKETGMEPGEWVEIALNALDEEAIEIVNTYIAKRADEQRERVMALFSTGAKEG